MLTDLVANNGLTDTYQAERFVKQYGGDWRYDHSHKLWMKYEAPLWRPEGPGEIRRVFIACARSFQRHAENILDSKARDKALSFAKYCQSRTGLEKVLGVAQNLEPIAVASTAWNRDPWLIGAPNGIIDLQRGRLLSGGRDRHISRSLGVRYNPLVRCVRWLQFLREVFDNDSELIAYIHRMLGYLLTGFTHAQLWWLLYGEVLSLTLIR